MTEFPLAPEVPMERVLLHEQIHRINNEFSSLIGAVSRTAAHSVNHEVKVALAHIIELLCHYAELHRALQMPENDTHIDAAAYLENLCFSITRSKLDGKKINLALTASPLRHGTRLATGMDKFESSYRALASLLNAGSSTTARLQSTFGGDAGSRSSTSWSKISMDALTRGLAKGDRSRY
jgi:hypothetical protein